MPQLPQLGANERVELSSDPTAYVVIQTGPVLGGDVVNVDDPENPMAISLAILAGRIKEWNFTEADGTPTPITLDNVMRLPMQDMTALFEKLDLKNLAPLAGEEKKSSLPTSEVVPTV